LEDLAAAAARIRLLILDVDGVLTDGGVFFGAEGTRLLRFDVKDGMGISLLRRAGVVCALVTCGASPAVQQRAQVLDIDDVMMGVPEDGKGAAVRQVMARHHVTPQETAYVGDDITDLPAFREVGLAIAVADAMPQVRQAAQWVTQAAGGRGAIREVADTILQAQSAS
jgi:3-deoxy-D-manno-octulosonate 8-phosphate phosphatase (KDO 8-P phosphatase)